MITAKEMSRSAGIKLEDISHQRDGEPLDENEKSKGNCSLYLVYETRSTLPSAPPFLSS